MMGIAIRPAYERPTAGDIAWHKHVKEHYGYTELAMTKDEYIAARQSDREHFNTGCGYVKRFGSEQQLCAYNSCARCSSNPNRRQA